MALDYEQDESVIIERFDAAVPFLQQGLKSFGSSGNAESKAKIQSGSVELDGKQIAIGENMQRCALELAQTLNLDEVQTFVLIHRSLEEESKELDAPKELTREFIESVRTFYYRERLAVLKCLAALGTRRVYVSHIFSDEGKQGMNALEEHLSKKLDDSFGESQCTVNRQKYQMLASVRIR